MKPLTHGLALLALALTATLAAPAVLAHGGSDHATTSPRHDASRVVDTPFGRAGDPASAARTIEIDMTDDMRFTPATFRAKSGETVRLKVANKGKVLHELVLGTPDLLRRHADAMRKFPGMEHDEPQMTHVQPGAQGEVVWQFTRAGEFQFACLLPGHFEAGMSGKVVVE
ncbi:cupredoxin domain-containing protein [Quisquiliibacterium transsilvanicum]|uniref:Putative cupredoxin-like copper-binding protein n=1 Tax=Quisquiliibacterium transsilvanicum TaxID=1549638 RepID=A0A7W8HF58_9BURK|nr:cupredoxin family protein [Quisquiliibacterium transsilvanicum]MBB5270753.1 putative cupredoxin-like copper-binding protein [Quisquiliibacterium transsilvanicum]